MNTEQEPRVSWLTRINIRTKTQEAFRLITDERKLPMSKVIGDLIEEFVTARSTA